MSYGVGDFGFMVTDRVRRETYLSAIDSYVRPGMRVLDLGCGTGFFTLAAARAGAFVTSVDMVDAVELLPALAKANGYESLVEVWKGDVRTAGLAPFDVVIADLRGNVPLYDRNLEVWNYVRANLVATEGILLSHRDTLQASLVSLPDWHKKQIASLRLDDHDWTAVEDIVLTAPTSINETRDERFVSTVLDWAEIDYASETSLSSRRFIGSGPVTVKGDSTVHGIAIHAHIEVAPGLSYTSAPGPNLATAYGQMLLPFRTPVSVRAEESALLDIAALQVSGRWQWEWAIACEAATVRQSSLDSAPLRAGPLSDLFPGGETAADGSAIRLL